MQAFASSSLVPCLRQAPRAFARTASTSAKGKGKGKGSATRKRQTAAPAPNSLTFVEAIKTLRALSPGDTTSAYELTLLPRLAASVNINSLRGRSFLVHDASNSKKKETIVVFAEGDKAEEAKREGADIVGGRELVDEILNNVISPTKIIATPDMLPVITRSQLPRFLGPKGLMPSAKRGSVTDDISKALQEAKGGLDWMGVTIGSPKKTAVAGDRGMVSVPIARITFTPQEILANVKQFSQEVLDVCNGVGTQAEVSKTGGSSNKKRAEIEKMFLSTSQGISVEVSDAKQLL